MIDGFMEKAISKVNVGGGSLEGSTDEGCLGKEPQVKDAWRK